jgi:hypothetical protein
LAIEGTYGFAYCGANGLGIGIFTIVGEQFEGIDYGGGRYSGTARENADGTISLAIEFEVPPGIGLVQGTAPQDIPYRRRIEQQLPAGFGDGRPSEIASPPGLTVMVKRVPDDYRRALSEGLSVMIGNSRI